MKVHKIYIHLYKLIIILLHFFLKDGMLDIKVNTLTNPDSKLAESIEW